jgi:hypothetical protein
VIRRLLSLFRRRKPHPGVFVGRARTCDGVAPRNRRFVKPSVFYSEQHLELWIHFLRQRCSEGLITTQKLYQKIRVAVRACREQRRSVGFLPADNGDPDGYYKEQIRREFQSKLRDHA